MVFNPMEKDQDPLYKTILMRKRNRKEAYLFEKTKRKLEAFIRISRRGSEKLFYEFKKQKRKLEAFSKKR
ncbi:CLUMA_CG018614, isoform A [Clunio marinus]|uniref:CLUMA_CG018614, isoform A n=1 Tax=Clunio marinus TaxID=568069 RepID=A0A1J1IZ86_9DIPT|nr:CLUMA_CG018614, isoform A [Clunio marinus]